MMIVGKRRTSVARANIKEGTGKVYLNNEPVENYHPQQLRDYLLEPFILAKLKGFNINKIDVFVNVRGGGKISQISAARTAIGKALVEHFKSDELKKLFSEYDKHIIVSDVRQREPRKPWGHGKARGKKQKSYR